MSSNAQGGTRRKLRQLIGSLRGTEQLGVAEGQGEYSPARWRRQQESTINLLCIGAEDVGTRHEVQIGYDNPDHWNNHEQLVECKTTRYTTKGMPQYRNATIQWRRQKKYNHCAISLGITEFIDARQQSETLGGCRGHFKLLPAITLDEISHAILYREGYLLCSGFDSYLGRCSRGRVQGYPYYRSVQCISTCVRSLEVNQHVCTCGLNGVINEPGTNAALAQD